MTKFQFENCFIDLSIDTHNRKVDLAPELIKEVAVYDIFLRGYLTLLFEHYKKLNHQNYSLLSLFKNYQ